MSRTGWLESGVHSGCRRAGGEGWQARQEHHYEGPWMQARELGVILGTVAALSVLSGREERPSVSCVLGK